MTRQSSTRLGGTVHRPGGLFDPAKFLSGMFGIAAAALLFVSFQPARAQEAAPEPVVEDAIPEPENEAPAVEPVVEDEQGASSSSTAAPVVDPPSRVARLGYIDGDVTVAPAGTEEWADAALNRPLTSGDRIWVEKGGRTELQVGSSVVYLDGDTGFGFIELDDGVMQASLTEGAATVRVRRLAEGETIQIETPHSTVVLKSVGEYHLEVDKEGDRTIVKTRSGEADVRGDKKTYTVRDGERGVFTGLESLTANIERLPPRTAFENWANDRDIRAERSKSAQYVSRDVIGYEDLDDNGEWVSEPEYGYVWRPTVVVSNWAPYRYGRWAYVSPWGWTWIDDARWGFAPSHYGRWAYVRERWCWVPGPRHLRPVYAPALVGWIGGPSSSVSVSFSSGVGWYPLGPREVYYPGYRHTPRYIRYVNVSNTIVVNNTYFYGRRHAPYYDYRKHPHAVTIVSRDRFVGGRPIRDGWMHVDERNMRNWRNEPRGPAITPYRESVLAGDPRRTPRDADRFRGFGGSRDFNRVPFHTERSAIEANGGRPISRAQLTNRNPKDGDSAFRSVGQSGVINGDIKRREREQRTDTQGFANRDNNRSPREFNNDSVREWQGRRDRDRDGSGASPRIEGRDNNPRNTDRQRDARERLEVIRAQESTESQNTRRDNHRERPPVNSLRPDDGRDGGSSFYNPPDRFRERSNGSNPVIRDRESPQPRQWSQPRQDSSPPKQRDYTPPPKSYSAPAPAPRVEQPRSQPQPRNYGNSDRGSSPKSSNRDSGSRPRTMNRDR